MNVLDLFSGIGGFSLGLGRAGMKTVAFCETDDYACRVLEKHWPDVPIFGDIKKLHMRGLNESIDVVCGGFPCQPVSLAGTRAGDLDDRWLWPEMRRVIGEVKPRWVLAENVRGLLSAENGRLFGGILRDLAELGYAVEWHCISAAAVGAPHIRDRVWIIGQRQSVAHAQCPERRSYNMAHGDSGQHSLRQGREEGAAGIGAVRPLFSNAISEQLRQQSGRQRWPNGAGPAQPAVDGEAGYVADARRGNGEGSRRGQRGEPFSAWWEFEPDVGRVANGIPKRMDQLRCLGNAVVPQVVELIGRAIMCGGYR